MFNIVSHMKEGILLKNVWEQGLLLKILLYMHTWRNTYHRNECVTLIDVAGTWELAIWNMNEQLSLFLKMIIISKACENEVLEDLSPADMSNLLLQMPVWNLL